MPFYDYQCKKCEHSFNTFKKIDDRNVPTMEKCPSCGKSGCVEMLIGAPGFSDPVRLGLVKPDREFTNLLDTIKKRNTLRSDSS